MTTSPRSHVAAFTFVALMAGGSGVHAQDAAPSPAVRPPSIADVTAPTADDALTPLDTAHATRGLHNPQRSPLTGRPGVWRDLFAQTWDDARHLPSRQTLGWVAIGAAASLSTRPADSQFGHSLSTARQLSEPFEPGAVIGSTPLQMGVSLATYAVGRATASPRMIAVGADLFRAQLISQGLTIGIKESIRRRRPEGNGFAFPSGHTTVSFASATVLQQHFGWRVGAPAYALASYVALSRVQMNRHYLSDVAFGAALGIAAGRTITLGRERRMMLAPMAADGGAGIQVTWLGKR
ncbi:MAG TPA: phosphatase PAP2 family protein [Vicinamibacterales bacterium]|nr:phosphatase PAP2 family protein [Vicinamibacterales bacterium]